MDQGHFLTDSGSKIPQLRPRENLPVPEKPKLTATTIKTTEFVNAAHTAKQTNLTKMKQGTGRSVPNVAKATTFSRSKTTIKPQTRRVAETPSTSLKRPAPCDNGDVCEAKIPRPTPKSGLPYKAKSWELKLRLAECEEWLLSTREQTMLLEETIASNNEELLRHRQVVTELEAETARANDLQDRLNSKTADHEKLCADSKDFVEKIASLERTISHKEQTISTLESQQSRLREEAFANTAEISKLRLSLDDAEFKLRRQKTVLDDLESSYEQSKKECVGLHERLKDRDNLLSTTQEKLDTSERENKIKANILQKLSEELTDAKSTISDLERKICSSDVTNTQLSRDLTSVRDVLEETRNKLDLLTVNYEEMRAKLCDSEKLRRYLHNQVQDLKGNIRVFCRVRPPIPSEKESCTMCSINYPDEGSIEVSKGDPFESVNVMGASRPKFQKHEFTFDRVFNPGADQSIVFDEISQLVQSALDGYNVCIFAYGQTGSGKTYTMEGERSSDKRGMIPRTVQHIFESAQDLQKIGWNYTVEVCFIEIYNEIIRDLLRSDKEGSNLKIMQVDGKTNDVVIPGLTVMKVQNCEDLDRLYILAHQNRAVASTCYNEHSSRSHSITKIKVTGIHKERNETCYGSLNLVDLAGSERLSEQASANEDRFREMKNINKSLSELGNVIQSLYQKQDHVPYRNSKLTHLLQPALGGSSKTLMLVNISPVENCLNETLCSLRFAQKVNQVKVGLSKKRIMFDSGSSR